MTKVYFRCLSIISVGIVFLIVAAVGISTESLRGKWVFTQGLGKSSNLAVIGGPLKAVYSKPAWAFLVASIFPNSFQLFGMSKCIFLGFGPFYTQP